MTALSPLAGQALRVGERHVEIGGRRLAALSLLGHADHPEPPSSDGDHATRLESKKRRVVTVGHRDAALSGCQRPSGDEPVPQSPSRPDAGLAGSEAQNRCIARRTEVPQLKGGGRRGNAVGAGNGAHVGRGKEGGPEGGADAARALGLSRRLGGADGAGQHDVRGHAGEGPPRRLPEPAP